MRWIWLAATVLLLTACGVQPSGVSAGGEAPTGVAPGVTLYFVDAHGQLRPQLRPTGHLGSISDALALLLTGSGDSDLHSEITTTPSPRVLVTPETGVIELSLPLTIQDVTELGIEQIVCTALGVQVQSGGSRNLTVRVRFVQPTPESDKRRTCPLFR